MASATSLASEISLVSSQVAIQRWARSIQQLLGLARLPMLCRRAWADHVGPDCTSDCSRFKLTVEGSPGLVLFLYPMGTVSGCLPALETRGALLWYSVSAVLKRSEAPAGTEEDRQRLLLKKICS